MNPIETGHPLAINRAERRAAGMKGKFFGQYKRPAILIPNVRKEVSA